MRFHPVRSTQNRCLHWHAPGAAAHPPIRVLVVDDHHDTAEVLATVFRLERYETTIAHDGHTALRLADTFSPDVILLDITLPDISGIEVARIIRSTGFRGGIIAVTALGYEKDVAQYEQSGFDAFCQKPVDIDELVSLVIELSSGDGYRPGPH